MRHACKACSGTGVSSKGGICAACGGTMVSEELRLKLNSKPYLDAIDAEGVRKILRDVRIFLDRDNPIENEHLETVQDHLEGLLAFFNSRLYPVLRPLLFVAEQVQRDHSEVVAELSQLIEEVKRRKS